MLVEQEHHADVDRGGESPAEDEQGDGEEVEQDRAAFDYSLAPPWKGAMLWPVSNTSASMILGDR